MSAGSCAVVMTTVATGSVASVGTFAHGPGWCGDPEEEVFSSPTAIVTTSGTWRLHGWHGTVDADEGIVVLGHRGESYRCSHPAGPTDQTLFVTVRGDYELPASASLPRRPPLDIALAALCRASGPLRVDAIALTILATLHDLPTGTPRVDSRRRRIVAEACEYLERNSHRDGHSES